MAFLYPITFTHILTISTLLHKAQSLPHTNTSSPTIDKLAVHSDETCHNTTSSTITPKIPDQTFLSTTTFGVLSIVLAFGSLVVGILGVLQYRRRRRGREAARACALGTQSVTIGLQQLQTGQDALNTPDRSSSSELPASLVVETSTSSDVSSSPLTCDIKGGDESPTATPSDTLIPEAWTTSANLHHEEPVEEVQVQDVSAATRPVQHLRFRSSIRHARKVEDGFGGCYRTFTY